MYAQLLTVSPGPCGGSWCMRYLLADDVLCFHSDRATRKRSAHRTRVRSLRRTFVQGQVREKPGSACRNGCSRARYPGRKLRDGTAHPVLTHEKGSTSPDGGLSGSGSSRPISSSFASTSMTCSLLSVSLRAPQSFLRSTVYLWGIIH